MRAGQLRNRIELQRNTGTAQDAYGAPVDDWQTYALRWARIEPLSGGEQEAARTYAATVSHAITVRDVGELTISPGHRIKLAGRIFSPHAILPGERSIQFRIMATEIVA